MSKARVLVVDDDRDFAESLAEVIEDRGHYVEIAFSGEEAVEVFRTHDFDITLMDMKLPGMNGVESFGEFRKLKSDAKVVMMTGYSVEDLIRQAQDEGALAVFHKPLDLTRLMKFIEDANSKGGNILLVDDNEDFIQSTKEFLRDKGYSVAIARNGLEALEKIQTEDIKTLLLDLRMPIMGGLEVYMELKKRGQMLPTIIMTGFPEDKSENLETIISMENTCLLFKPFKPDELIKLIEFVMNQNK